MKAEKVITFSPFFLENFISLVRKIFFLVRERKIAFFFALSLQQKVLHKRTRIWNRRRKQGDAGWFWRWWAVCVGSR